MVKKAAKQLETQPEQTPKQGPSFFEYLRFGESYTSLILGIIVVIISTALLLSFVHNRNNVNAPTPNNEQTKNVAQQNPQVTSDSSITPSVSPEVTKLPSPTTAPTAKPTVKPSVTQKVIAKASKAPSPTQKPKNVQAPVAKQGEYIVKSGDTLWSIAEAKYKSGYNWIDIARANKLSNPGDIFAGNKLVLPKVTAKTPTVVDTKGQVATNDEKNNATKMDTTKITGNAYKIVRGDTLWSIAVRAYNDGYKWVVIAKTNALTNPNLIHAGNTLIIPRK